MHSGDTQTPLYINWNKFHEEAFNLALCNVWIFLLSISFLINIGQDSIDFNLLMNSLLNYRSSPSASDRLIGLFRIGTMEKQSFTKGRYGFLGRCFAIASRWGSVLCLFRQPATPCSPPGGALPCQSCVVSSTLSSAVS